MENNIRDKDLNYSIVDGALSAIMGSLAGGMFLTGFALKVLKAQPQQIGVLAALPMFANLVQIFGSYIIEKTGKKKALCTMAILLSRILWIIIILLPLTIFAPLADWRVWVLVVVIAGSSLFGSLGGIAWTAWMSDIVPGNKRGTFFGRRNMVASGCGMIVMLLGGKFITVWENRFTESDPFGFIILFVIGLAAGLISMFFLSRVPEKEAPKKDAKKSPGLSIFFKPLKDKNFLALIIFASFWMFSIQIAAPFYGVFMIDNLKINFIDITILGTFATFATLFMMKIWGPISDNLGNKPVIAVSGLVLVGVPFIWVLALPGNYYLPLLIAHILSGAFMAGASLSQFNIMIKLSPEEGRSVYFAIFAAITGITGAIAPVIGGNLSHMLRDLSFTVLDYNVSNLHMIFIISAVLQFLSILFIFKVKEPAAASPVAVVMQLKNDLNPQAGIAGTADFVMIELKAGESILRKIDKATDKVADRSEGIMRKILERIEKVIEKPLKKIKDFLTSDD
jgi:MFS family permease